MKFLQVALQASRALSVIALMSAPVSISYAAELVGKPATVGGYASSSSASRLAVSERPAMSAASVASVVSTAASAAAQAATSSLSKVEELPVAPAAPIAPIPEVDADEVSRSFHQAMEDARRDFNYDFEPNFGHSYMTPETIIPIVAMSLLFGGPVLLFIILAILHYRAKVRRQQNINVNIDKLLAAGRDIPVELLLGQEPPVVRRTAQGDVAVYGVDEYMRKGVRNLGLGTGWLVFLTIVFGIKVGAFGFILIGLGISQVVIWKLSEPSAPATSTSSDVARIQE